MANNQKKKKTYNSLKKKKYETFFQYLRRIIKIGWVQIVIGLIGLLITLSQLLPPSEETTLRKDITSKIELIESSFHPETIQDELTDTIGEIKMIRGFQNDVLKFCTLYYTIETSSIKILKNEELNIYTVDKFQSIMNQYIDNIEMKNLALMSIEQFIIDSKKLSEEHNIEEYKIIDISKVHEIIQLMKEQNLYYDNIRKKIKERLKNNRMDKVKNKIIDDIESLHSSKKQLRTTDRFLTFLIDTNKILSIRINNIRSNKFSNGRDRNQTEEDRPEAL